MELFLEIIFFAVTVTLQKAFFKHVLYGIQQNNNNKIKSQLIPSIPSHSQVSRRHQLLSPNLLLLFNSSSPATAQKPLPPIRHICGLGASVGCERVERTFNAPRLKSQICLIGGNGFVCSLSNELNSNFYHIFELFIIIYQRKEIIAIKTNCFQQYRII